MVLEKSTEKPLKRADPSTIQNKFLVGYQGWFTCAGDGEPVGPGHHGWLHWFNYPMPDGGRPNTDIWPDVSEYSPSELYVAPGLRTKSGERCFLFSSRHPKSVQRHFHWMAEHGVDGAFLQRFAGQTDREHPGNEGILRIRDEVGDRVREAAEKEGRVFAIMYDVTGVAPDRIQRVIEQDWLHLVHRKAVLDSPNYLRERGKAVVAIWGKSARFGFAGNNHSPSVVRAITSYLRDVTPGGVYIMAGVPAHWRTSVQDADPDPDFVNVWLTSFDAISPWTVGRYSNEDEADRFADDKMKGDVELIKRTNDASTQGARRLDYIPVVLPGGSGYNLSEGAWSFNGIKRNGGRFLWRQIFNARRLGTRIVYGAMWDEYDEGTAFMPVVPYKSQLPVSDRFDFLALDADGYDLPSDWYMRICGFAAEGLRGERMIHESFPQKELQDYWETRPRYDYEAIKEGIASGSGPSENHLAVINPDEPPPPPYTEDEVVPPAPQSTVPLPERSASAVASPVSGPRASSTRPAAEFESTHMINDLIDEMNRHSVSSPFAGAPPLPPRSTSSHRASPSPRPYQPLPHQQQPTASDSDSCAPEMFLPMPAFPTPVSPADHRSPGQSLPPQWDQHHHAETNLDYALDQDQDYLRPGYQPFYMTSGPPPLPPPLSRPGSLSAHGHPGALNEAYDPYPERRRVQSSAAFYRPSPAVIDGRPPSPDVFFPQAYGASGHYPGSDYPAGPQYPLYQQNPAYGQHAAPPLPSTPRPSQGHYHGHNSHVEPYTYSPSPPLPPPPRPPPSPHYQARPLRPSSSDSHKKSSSASAINKAKDGLNSLVGGRAGKAVQNSVQNALKPFSK